MKKALSLVLSIVMLMSVFSVLSVTVSAAEPADVMYVKSNGLSGGKLTYDIYLKKNISLIGTIVKVVYDPAVLKPVSGGAHSSASSVNGIFVADMIKGSNNAYSMAFVSMDSYNVGSADKAFMTVTFEVINKSYPKADVKFYCVEFNTSDTSKKLEKNDANPPLIQSFSQTTLDKITYVGAYSVENGLRVEWKATPGATGYYVYKLNSAGTKYEKIGETKANKLYFDDTSVAANSSAKYIVRAYNASGIDSAAVNISGYYVKAPSKVAVSIQPKGIKVGWYLVNGATSYRIYRRVINPDNTRSGWTYLYTAGAKQKNYIDTKGLQSDTYYEYTVRSYTANGTSAVCRYAAIRYYPAPTVAVKAVSGGVKVSWNQIAGAKQYAVYRKYNGAKSWTYLGSVSADTLSYVDKAANSGRNIFYTVRAVGNGSKSSFVAKKIAYVGIPHLLSAKNIVGGVQVKWSAINNAKGYRVYRRAAGEKGWTYLTTVKTTSYTDKNVKSGVYYKYTVRTVFNKLYSGYESGILVRYMATPKLTSIANSGSGITVRWNAVGGAASYRVYRRAAGEKGWKYIKNTTSTSFTDSNVKKGVTYRYTVRAVNRHMSSYNSGLAIKRS